MSNTAEEKIQKISAAESDRVSLVQITDCHIFAEADNCLQGVHTRHSFEAVSEAVIANSGHLDLLLATGDLSQDGSTESYDYLAQRVDAMGIATFWLPGNHDDIETLRERFVGQKIHSAKQVLIADWQIVLLDSTIRGEVHGRVCETQLEFLHDCLRDHPEKHALVCLHHQALDTGSFWIDQKGLHDSAKFRENIDRHDNVRGVLWGHVHQETQQSIGGVEWMSTPSSCIQFKPYSREFAIGTETPGYRQLELYADGRITTRVHRVESF
ncbi:MAG: 3',5'-cyclic-AMP phosphodiesterase [Gammaproteobacteria bacterium]|nr:3',5'-cyclic-AMP phosphodiesterase [Gammaproteobacteria bacterium]